MRSPDNQSQIIILQSKLSFLLGRFRDLLLAASASHRWDTSFGLFDFFGHPVQVAQPVITLRPALDRLDYTISEEGKQVLLGGEKEVALYWWTGRSQAQPVRHCSSGFGW